MLCRSIAQLSPEYTDSEEVKSGFRFDDESDAFQIQDNLLISYDFEEALSPVWLNQLGLAKEYGLGYRIYVKDAHDRTDRNSHLGTG